MKSEIYKWAIVLAAAFKLIKLVAGIFHETPYAIHDLITFVLSSAIIIAFLFLKSDKMFKFAVIGLLVSNIAEYLAVSFAAARIALGLGNFLVLVVTLYLAIKSARSERIQKSMDI